MVYNVEPLIAYPLDFTHLSCNIAGIDLLYDSSNHHMVHFTGWQFASLQQAFQGIALQVVSQKVVEAIGSEKAESGIIRVGLVIGRETHSEPDVRKGVLTPSTKTTFLPDLPARVLAARTVKNKGQLA